MPRLLATGSSKIRSWALRCCSSLCLPMPTPKRWYGRKARLAELPADGNGQLTVRSHRTGEVIYRHFFSTLFQEWLSYPEAETTSRAFENVFLVPMPKDTVDVTVTLRDNRRQVMCEMTHTVAPQDILIRHIGQENVTPYVTLQQAADPDHCIHIAFVAEGYQESEMDTYIADAQTAIDAIFAHEPFKTERSKFNIIAVKSPSKDSGTSTPSKGIWKNTALHSHFDTFYSNRYLTTLSIKTLHDWLAGTPYEHIIILVNTDEYGGGGILNSYVLSMTHHAKYRPVITHEFGHSFCLQSVGVLESVGEVEQLSCGGQHHRQVCLRAIPNPPRRCVA